MSETVLIAVITLVSGMIGSITGALLSYKLSMLNVKSERGKTLHDEKRIAYSEIVSAYTKFVEIMVQLESEAFKPDEEVVTNTMFRIYNAQTAVLLLAPEKVSSLTKKVCRGAAESLAAGKFTDKKLPFDELLVALREDLLSFNS